MNKEDQFYEFIHIVNYIKKANINNLFDDNYLFNIGT
jgi:hypothetical protein